MTEPHRRLVIGVSTRALFSLEAENEIFEIQGLAAYRTYQREHEKDVLKPGTAYPLVRDLLAINTRSGRDLVEVFLLSRNDADSSMRVFNSIEALGLPVTRGAFRGGRDPWVFLPAFNSDLFLSAEPSAVRAALSDGIPAALVLRPPEAEIDRDQEVRIAFDGDGVLFDEESDRIYQTEGAEAYFRHERENSEIPLSPGPFKPFLTALAAIQAEFAEDEAPIRTALVTARNAPAHFRVVNTFRAWDVRVDEAFFVGPLDKAEIVSRLRPHIFLDDRFDNLVRAAQDVPAAQIPSPADQMTIFADQEGSPEVAGRRQGASRARRPIVGVAATMPPRQGSVSSGQRVVRPDAGDEGAAPLSAVEADGDAAPVAVDRVSRAQ